jgi:hypothetical protein
MHRMRGYPGVPGRYDEGAIQDCTELATNKLRTQHAGTYDESKPVDTRVGVVAESFYVVAGYVKEYHVATDSTAGDIELIGECIDSLSGKGC